MPSSSCCSCVMGRGRFRHTSIGALETPACSTICVQSYTVIFVDTLLKTKDSDFQSLREAGWR